MKILFVGHFGESIHSGWKYALIQYAKSILATGADLVIRPHILGNRDISLPEDLRVCLNKSAAGCDYLIQGVLPYNYEYSGHFKKNVGICFLDSEDMLWSGWPYRMRLLDKIIVPNNHSVKYLRYEEKINCGLVPVPCDISEYDQPIEPIDIPGKNGDYLFYFIGDLNKRKNLVGLLEAFYREFSYTEPVQLLLKISKSGCTDAEIQNEINYITDTIQKNMKLYRYKTPLILTQKMSRHDLLRLHKSCDCLVAPSHNEAWGLPIFDAYALGNSVIATAVGGPAYFLPRTFLIGCTKSPCKGMTDSFPTLFTSRETFYQPNMTDLQYRMRAVYNGDIVKEKPDISQYSYKVVGSQLLNELN